MLDNINFRSLDEVKKQLFTAKIMKKAWFILYAFVMVLGVWRNSALILLLSIICLLISLGFQMRDHFNTLRMEIRNIDTLMRLRR